jgi:chaperonin cofactor prefoldin
MIDEQLQSQIEDLRQQRDDLEAALDDAIGEVGQLKQALIELEEASRRPFATIEHIGFLARRALDT